MSRDQEPSWEQLQRLWQSEGVPPDVDAAARRRAERGRRRMLLAIVMEAFVVVAIGAWSVHLLATQPDPAIIVTLLVFWTFAGILVGFGILTRRGTWAPDSESTRSYLKLSLERARRREEFARGALKLMALWLIAAMGLLLWSAVDVVREGEALLPLLRNSAAVFVMTFGLLGILTEWSRRRARAEITKLEGIVDAFREDEEAGQAEGEDGSGHSSEAGRL